MAAHILRGKWRRGIVLVAIVLLLLLTRPAWHLLKTAWHDRHTAEPLPAGQVDDASHLNLTAVAEIVDVPVQRGRLEEQLASLLARARAQKLRVSIAGARHSMGGHTIFPGGIAVNMLPFKGMVLD
ncbi:MAG: hypothetical protein VB858_05295, partial [Planctomycetaceae bacterium]